MLGRQPRRALWVFAAVELLSVAPAVVNLALHPALRIPGLIYSAVVVVTSVVAALVVRARMRSQTWLFAGPDRVGYQGLRNKPRQVLRADLRAVRRVSALGFSRLRTAQMRGRHLLFLGAGDVCLLRVAAEAFVDSDLDQFLAAVEAPVEGSWADLATTKQLRRRFPRSFAWAMVHVLALSLFGALVVGILVVVIALTLVRHA